jgi:hypothetical protein
MLARSYLLLGYEVEVLEYNIVEIVLELVGKRGQNYGLVPNRQYYGRPLVVSAD